MTDTAIRVSNAYSRQIEYDLAHGTENKFYKAMSLLSPRKYDRRSGNRLETAHYNLIERNVSVENVELSHSGLSAR